MIYVVIPVFNEQVNIPDLAKNLLSFSSNNKSQFFFVFVDDCSTDQTTEEILKLFNEDTVKIIKKAHNKGPGDSFNLGFEWVLNQNVSDSDLVLTIEADNTSDLNILPCMILLAENHFELVLASVYAQGGGFEKTSFIRIVLSFIANMFFRAAFNIKILTLSSFYRVYRVSLLRKIKSSHTKIIEESGFISMLEILIKAIKQDASIIEVPMKLKSLNRKGKSKMKLVKTAISYFKFLIRKLF